MKNRVVVELASDVPEAAAAILDRVPALMVKRRKRGSKLMTDGAAVPLVVVHGGVQPYAHSTAPLLASLAGDGRLGFVVADRLPAHVRRELEAAGCAYAEGTGALHIDVPGLLLHIEPATQPAVTAMAPRGVGVVGVRLVQVILGDAKREWTVAALAKAAASSTGQAHNVFMRLESEGLVTATGRGPGRRRRVANPGELLDWLATVPTARRLRERLPAFLYSPDPEQLVSRLSAYALDSGVRYALTGAAGAAVLGVRVTTAAPVIMVRVDPDIALLSAAHGIGAEPVDSGANLMLVRDLGRLGVHGSARAGPVTLAPPVRIWLDMLGEPRGEDTAALFREAFLGW